MLNSFKICLKEPTEAGERSGGKGNKKTVWSHQQCLNAKHVSEKAHLEMEFEGGREKSLARTLREAAKEKGSSALRGTKDLGMWGRRSPGRP